MNAPFPVAPHPLARPADADWLDALNAALHGAIAAKLRARPSLLGIAVQNVRLWRQQRAALDPKPAAPCASGSSSS